MRSTAMMASRLFLFVFAAALLAAFGCSNAAANTNKNSLLAIIAVLLIGSSGQRRS